MSILRQEDDFDMMQMTWWSTIYKALMTAKLNKMSFYTQKNITVIKKIVSTNENSTWF